MQTQRTACWKARLEPQSCVSPSPKCLQTPRAPLNCECLPIYGWGGYAEVLVIAFWWNDLSDVQASTNQQNNSTHYNDISRFNFFFLVIRSLFVLLADITCLSSTLLSFFCSVFSHNPWLFAFPSTLRRLISLSSYLLPFSSP